MGTGDGCSRAYSVACGELLLCADDGTASLRLVQGALAADHGLTLRSSATGLAANLGNGIPVVHDVGYRCMVDD